MRALYDLLLDRTAHAEQLAELLDSLDHPQRVTATRAMPRRLLGRLYQAVQGAAPLSVHDFVPKGHPPYRPVCHIGTNSMPLFRRFEKIMYRLPDGRVAGHNKQTWAAVTGPGYFFAEPSSREAQGGGVQLNYDSLPPTAPPGWPRIDTNDRGLSRIVYGGMVDTMRRVSAHVTIGQAERYGRAMDTYFVLVRDADVHVRASGLSEPKRSVNVA